MTQKPGKALTWTGTLILLTGCVLLVGCSDTQLVTSKKSAKFNGPAFKKILVLGVAKRPEIQQAYEDGFVKELAGVGVEGVPAYRFLPTSTKPDRAAIVQAMKASGADAVLVTRLVKVDKVTEDSETEPNYLFVYYETAWPDSYESPAVQSYDVVTLESKLFDGSDSQVVWSGTTRTVDPVEVKKVVSDMSKEIVRALLAQKLISAK